MHVLIFKDRGISTTKYRSQLEAWGVTSEEVDAPAIVWQGQDIDPAWLRTFTATLYEKRGETVDAIQFITSDWQGGFNIRGKHYHYPYGGYQVGVVRERRGWEDTARHELMHTFDDIVRIYLGISLAKIVKVADWDEDVVHGRDRRFKEYEYDDAWKAVRGHVNVAIALRKQLAKMSWRQRAVVLLRQLAQQLMARQENITVPEEMAHPVPKEHRKAISQRFLNPNKSYRSGVHNGTDWALPVGTPILAPRNGYVEERFVGPETGNGCVYRFEWNGEEYAIRLLHLRGLPVEGDREQGQVIGFSGDTGMSTGPHCHIDLWPGGVVDVSKILTPQGVINNLKDPEAFFADAV